MEIRSIATARFDAAHKIPDYPPCERLHGHSWVVEVAVGGELDPLTGMVRGAPPLQAAVERWCAELDNGDLAELMPGVVTSPLGIASACLDALALRFPKILTVRVLCTDGSRGEVSRTSRQI